MTIKVAGKHIRGYRQISLLLVLLFVTAPIAAQQPANRPAAPAKQTAKLPNPTFENLLATDAYKLYGEVRNVGQLLGTGGAGEIVDPIIKLADPGKEFKSIVTFLKKNSEALFSSRLMFATWPARTDVPTVFVAIEFPTDEDAAKFAPKLETFLPTLVPPVPVTPEPPKSATPANPPTPKPNPSEKPASEPSSTTTTTATVTEEHFPFVVNHAGNLVFISDRSFKFEKLHPVASKPLSQDQNFRATHDRFSTEPVFLFFNVALEDKTKQQPSPTSAVITADTPRVKPENKENTAEQTVKPEPEPAATPIPDQVQTTEVRPVLTGGPEPSPTPTPTNEQQAQAVASSQIGHMLDAIGFGEPQWPEAVGLALALDGNEYVVRSMLIDKPDAKVLPIPFLPQLIAGPAYNAEAASVLPDDVEMFVSASIDLTQSFEGVRKAAEIKAKNEAKATITVRGETAVSQSNEKEPEPDAFAQFEKKAGFKIKDDLLAALGSEIAVAGSVNSLRGATGLFMGPVPSAAPSPEAKDQKPEDKNVLPILLIGIRDREAMRKLMPKVLVGLGIGEANLIAQKEQRGDAEIVNYAGMFAYGFIGDFLVISDVGGVRRVAAANENHQTLSSNTVYRNSRRWEPMRQLGQIYISPSLMEAYHEQVRKGAASLEPAMRDFLLGLNPKTEAITYALSNEGLGTNHELHLPKNLILTMVAGISSAAKNPPSETNEQIAMGVVQMIAGAEAQYKEKNGSYGSLQQMIDAKVTGPMEPYDQFGYKYDVTVTGDQFEVVATPKEYGKTGKRSFFVDKSGVVRGEDHGGGAATVADKQVYP